MVASLADGSVPDRPDRTAQRRSMWIAVAIATSWMTSTLVAGGLIMVGIVSPSNAAIITIASTSVLSVLLYRRFWRRGRVDELPVIGVLVCWATVLGLLSL